MPHAAPNSSGPVAGFAEQERQFARAFRAIEKAIAARVFPAASLAVIYGGQLAALRGFGRFTYDAGAPQVTAETMFDLASLTKVVATTAMAMFLYEGGELDLEVPVAAILPDFAKGDARRRQVTVRMLLAHSSGLPAYARLFEAAATRQALLEAAIHMPLEADPGARAAYSDIGFIVLGEVLARIAGEPLDAFCRREVFGPLGLVSTVFCPPAELRPLIPPTQDDRAFRDRVIQGEVHDENSSVLGGVSAHAGLFSNAADLARFAHVMLGGGTPILRSTTVELFTRRSELPPGSSRALGWDTPSPPSQSGRYFSGRSYGHLGYTGCSLWIDPERGLSVTLLTNRTWPDANDQRIKQVRPAVHDAILEALA